LLLVLAAGMWLTILRRPAGLTPIVPRLRPGSK
jgi:hypothetical protein